jgi:hypothetical protein
MLDDKQTFIVQGYRLLYEDNNFYNTGKMASYNEKPLLDKLSIYGVNNDTEAKENDNIFLTLRHANKNEATIRIYNHEYSQYSTALDYDYKKHYYLQIGDDSYKEITMDEEIYNTTYKGKDLELYVPNYKIKLTIANASGGTQTPDPYDLSRWLNGELTAEEMGLAYYVVTSIGTMGAYFVLAKDETQEVNIKDYGINQLQAKYDKYLEIFLLQTQDMLSNSKKECIASDDEPHGIYTDGTRWLDTNSKPVTLKEYKKDEGWVNINVEDDEEKSKKMDDAVDYARYIANYEKMIAIQEMLVKKKKIAEYYKYGYSVNMSKSVLDLSDGSSLQENMHNVAFKHFNTPLGTYDTLTELTQAYPNGTDGVCAIGSTLYLWNKTSKEWTEGEYTVVSSSMDTILPLYTFTTDVIVFVLSVSTLYKLTVYNLCI